MDRVLYKWADRNDDFDVWRKPIDHFGLSASTVHAAGETLEKEVHACKSKDERTWHEKIVVDDLHFKTHRCAHMSSAIMTV